MNDDMILRLTGQQHAKLQAHLFPGDGLEAVALALCGRRNGKGRHCLSVSNIVLVPHERCDRFADRVTWPTDFLEPLLAEASKQEWAVVKIHSHPGGYDRFSGYDDRSDRVFFDTTESWTESDAPHGSVVMLPGGKMFGRVGRAGGFQPMDAIAVAGDSIEYWTIEDEFYVPDFADRHAQVLGAGTFEKLRRLRVAVVGCSGTGSPTIEQLFRLGVGELVLVDPDTIGPENLNRILNSRGRHAQAENLKVDVAAHAIEDTGLGTTVISLPVDLCTTEAVEIVGTCDVIIGCVDSVFARHLLNKISSTYCIPYIDIGVGLRADGNGGIAHATGAVQYLQPDGSSLLSRKVFSQRDIQSDILQRTDPEEYRSRLDDGYIKGAEVSKPAVITINTIFSGYGVWELLCRMHAIRDDGSYEFANQRWSLSGNIHDHEAEGERCPVVSRHLGFGDMVPLLGMPELSPRKASIDANH
ncbi:ThiF family adenylyltransferase [Novipirellula rosea]|uniref:ThiF family adenylyltransferase n=1 Tax=Novipirellula rosea TaxID=1031540 RepID=A0ABP8M9N1_9BACT